jgi:hypothetical protein
MIGGANQRVANRAQIGQCLLMRGADAGREFDHAFGDLRRDVAGDFFILDEPQQIGSSFGQIIVMSIDDLHLEFDTEGERLRIDEAFE